MQYRRPRKKLKTKECVAFFIQLHKNNVTVFVLDLIFPLTGHFPLQMKNHLMNWQTYFMKIGYPEVED